MKSVRDQLPEVASLEAKFEQVFGGGLGNFLSSTHTRREAVTANRRYTFAATAFLIAVLVALFFVYGTQEGLISKLLVGCLLLWAVVVLVTARQWFANTRLFGEQLRMAIVPLLMHTFDRTVVYAHGDDQCSETTSLLKTSQLLLIGNLKPIANECYTVYGEPDVIFRSVRLLQPLSLFGHQIHFASEVFRGVLMTAQLPQASDATTYVAIGGERDTVTNKAWWQALISETNLEEVKLEYSDVQPHLCVQSTNPEAARSLLNDKLTAELLAWHKQTGETLRLAIQNDQLYLLLPNHSIEIGTATTTTKRRTLERRMFPLARLLWRGLRVVEGVSQ